MTAWNKAVRRIWCLPYQAHRRVLCQLNNGKHAWDLVFKRFCKMHECMKNSKNEKLSFLIKMAEYDHRSIIAQNVSHICKRWCIRKESLLMNESYVFMPSVNDKISANMVRELRYGIQGFNDDECQDIIDYITTV